MNIHNFMRVKANNPLYPGTGPWYGAPPQQHIRAERAVPLLVPEKSRVSLEVTLGLGFIS